mmetsp:Transcript_5982/g.17304  ORF Transcript_5982/g.17304 Transcript_5982/m.17304 type:complete len:231 (+) Transcript_5982:945-1637(+)
MTTMMMGRRHCLRRRCDRRLTRRRRQRGPQDDSGRRRRRRCLRLRRRRFPPRGEAFRRGESEEVMPADAAAVGMERTPSSSKSGGCRCALAPRAGRGRASPPRRRRRSSFSDGSSAFSFFLSFLRFVSFRFEIKSARIGPRKFNFCGNRFSFFSVFSKGISRRMYVWVGLRMLCGSQSMFGDECLSGSDPSRYHLSRPLSARRRQNCSAAAAVRVLFDAFSIKGSGIDNR